MLRSHRTPTASPAKHRISARTITPCHRGEPEAPQPIATIVSAASYNWAVAPGSIAVAFGSKLGTSTAVANSARFVPLLWAGTTVTVTDGANVDRLAPLYYVSPTQVTFQIPPDTAGGVAMITVSNTDGTISLGSAPVFAAAPSLFSADGSGSGLAAAQVVRVKADGSQTYELVGANPIDLGPITDQLVLVLYGSGIRGRSSLGGVGVDDWRSEQSGRLC